MADSKIDPRRVTKPIQLLAAWLVGLTVVNGSFLTAAVALTNQQWERGALVIAAIFNVPLFLVALFVLQTKFRPELQEDTFYFEYISRKTESVVNLSKADVQETRIESLQKELTLLREQVDRSAIGTDALDWSNWLIALNDHRSDVAAIRAALKKAEIPLSTMFGKSSGTNPPNKWIISFNESMGPRYVIALLKVLVPFGFDGFHRWDPVGEAGEDEDVYIGSYGVTKYSKITPKLKSLLEGEVEEIDFHDFFVNAKAD